MLYLNLNSGSSYETANNGGFCCTADNSYHKYCGITNGINLFNSPAAVAIPTLTVAIDSNFQTATCETRCSNDANCKGYVIVTHTLPISYGFDTSWDECWLFTTTFPSGRDLSFNPTVSTNSIDKNANCPTFTTYNTLTIWQNPHEGCQIKSMH